MDPCGVILIITTHHIGKEAEEDSLAEILLDLGVERLFRKNGKDLEGQKVSVVDREVDMGVGRSTANNLNIGIR